MQFAGHTLSPCKRWASGACLSACVSPLLAAACTHPLALSRSLQIRANLPPGADGWGISLRGLMSMVVVGGLLITGIFWWLNRTVSGASAAAAPARPAAPCYACASRLQACRSPAPPAQFYRTSSTPTFVFCLHCPSSRRPQVVPKVQGSIPKRDKKKKKEPMGVGESFAFLAKNPYIRDLAFLVRGILEAFSGPCPPCPHYESSTRSRAPGQHNPPGP